MSPVSLLRDWKVHDMLLSLVLQENSVAVAIDEAHCVKKWLVLHVLIFIIKLLLWHVEFIILLQGW